MLIVTRVQLLIVGQRSPSVSSHGYLSTEDHITWNLNTSGKVRKRRRERPTRYRTSKTEGTITCNLMTEMTVHHIDIFYPLKQVPKSSLHLRRGIIQGLKYQKAGITGHHLRNCLPQDSVQFSSVTQLCPTLCDPMNCSTPGFPVHDQLPEFTQTHVHQVSDAIQPSHPLSSPLLLPSIPPSIRVLSNSQLFAGDGQSTGVSALASFLPKKSQG